MPKIRELAAPVVICTAFERENLEIEAVLRLLDGDLRGGGRIRALPGQLVQAMLDNLNQAEGLGEEIEGAVAL